jgi:hypothetical protein
VWANITLNQITANPKQAFLKIISFLG